MGSILSSRVSSQSYDTQPHPFIRGKRSGMVGVAYEDEVREEYERVHKPTIEANPYTDVDKTGVFSNIRAENLSGRQVAILEKLRQDMADPNSQPINEPYTFWERTSLVAIPINRLQPRLFYHPTTDFSKYTYDEMSVEEKELKARWMARLYEYSWPVPVSVWCGFLTVSMGMPPFYRMVTMTVASYVAVFVEWCRVYNNALPERQDLDDFVVAKELWYIKNVEAQELGLDARKDLFED